MKSLGGKIMLTSLALLVMGGVGLAAWLTYSRDARASLGKFASELNPSAGKGRPDRMFKDFEGAYIHGATAWVIAGCLAFVLLLAGASLLVKIWEKVKRTEFKTAKTIFDFAYFVPFGFGFSYFLTMLVLNLFSQLKSVVIGLVYGTVMVVATLLLFALPIAGLIYLGRWLWQGVQHLLDGAYLLMSPDPKPIKSGNKITKSKRKRMK